MLANPQTPSSILGRSSPVGAARQPKRPTANRDGATSSNTEKQPLWTPMLQSASKGKDLSEKQLILLGGTPDLQREFLDQLNPEALSRQNLRSNDRRKQRQNVPISNKFALGYTYHDVLDADQEDTLARMNVYMLANPSGQLGVLLRPLLTSKTVKDTLVTILLEWNDPFKWARQLRQWIRLLRQVILGLDEETKLAMEENMNAWKEKRAGPDAQSSTQQEVIASLGPGEWDEGLGFLISVVCVQSEKVERLERELGWGDDQFDFLQQWLRTVLLKHGGSLVYTATFEPNNVRTLIHTSLNIQSLLKRDVAKHNVIDRDKILIPPNWDSWGKIRILREGFDPEAISNIWSVEIQDPPEDSFDLSPVTANHTTKTEADGEVGQPASSTNDPSPSAVTIFEQSLPNPVNNSQPYSSQTGPSVSPEVSISATPFQEFLQSQSVILEKLKVEDDEALERVRNRMRQGVPSIDSSGNVLPSTSGSIDPVKMASSYNAGPANALLNDSIGAYRVNVNGIDMDAEEATRRLRERENERNNDATTPTATNPTGTGTASSVVTSGAVSPVRPGPGGRGDSGFVSTTNPGGGANDGGKPSNEALHGFFANLIKKGEQGRNRGGAGAGGIASGGASPRRESPAPNHRREE